jgi:hypothetical protein
MIEGPDNFFASLAKVTKTPFDFTIDPITSPCSAGCELRLSRTSQRHLRCVQ